MKQNKKVLRKKILNQRRSLSEAEWKVNSKLVCDRLQTLPLFEQANTIFAYFSFRQEVDLSPLFSLPKKWVFPRCVDKSLIWYLWQPGEDLIKDKYGIQTPEKKAKVVPMKDADLILVPTVACDLQGYRLGYGGGFYDRLLSSSEGVAIPSIGIVFDFAYLTQLPTDPWDIKLDYICTETQFSSN